MSCTQVLSREVCTLVLNILKSFGSRNNRRQISGSMSNKYSKTKNIDTRQLNRPQQHINTQNNIIIISNHHHTKSQNKSTSKNQGRLPVGSLLGNFGTNGNMKQKLGKVKPKVHDLVNAPYFKLPGSNSMVDEFVQGSSSRSGVRSNSKRKSGNFTYKKF